MEPKPTPRALFRGSNTPAYNSPTYFLPSTPNSSKSTRNTLPLSIETLQDDSAQSHQAHSRPSPPASSNLIPPLPTARSARSSFTSQSNSKITTEETPLHSHITAGPIGPLSSRTNASSPSLSRQKLSTRQKYALILILAHLRILTPMTAGTTFLNEAVTTQLQNFLVKSGGNNQFGLSEDDITLLVARPPQKLALVIHGLLDVFTHRIRQSGEGVFFHDFELSIQRHGLSFPEGLENLRSVTQELFDGYLHSEQEIDKLRGEHKIEVKVKVKDSPFSSMKHKEPKSTPLKSTKSMMTEEMMATGSILHEGQSPNHLVDHENGGDLNGNTPSAGASIARRTLALPDLTPVISRVPSSHLPSLVPSPANASRIKEIDPYIAATPIDGILEAINSIPSIPAGATSTEKPQSTPTTRPRMIIAPTRPRVVYSQHSTPNSGTPVSKSANISNSTKGKQKTPKKDVNSDNKQLQLENPAKLSEADLQVKIQEDMDDVKTNVDDVDINVHFEPEMEISMGELELSQLPSITLDISGQLDQNDTTITMTDLLGTECTTLNFDQFETGMDAQNLVEQTYDLNFADGLNFSDGIQLGFDDPMQNFEMGNCGTRMSMSHDLALPLFLTSGQEGNKELNNFNMMEKPAEVCGSKEADQLQTKSPHFNPEIGAKNKGSKKSPRKSKKNSTVPVMSKEKCNQLHGIEVSISISSPALTFEGKASPMNDQIPDDAAESQQQLVQQDEMKQDERVTSLASASPPHMKWSNSQGKTKIQSQEPSHSKEEEHHEPIEGQYVPQTGESTETAPSEAIIISSIPIAELIQNKNEKEIETGHEKMQDTTSLNPITTTENEKDNHEKMPATSHPKLTELRNWPIATNLTGSLV